jgi:hypothetical protein
MKGAETAKGGSALAEVAAASRGAAAKPGGATKGSLPKGPAGFSIPRSLDWNGSKRLCFLGSVGTRLCRGALDLRPGDPVI